jgi:hypothetical protein
MRRTTVLLGTALLFVSSGAAVGHAASRATGRAPHWPAPSDPLRRIRLAGLKPERHEFLAYHVHAHLDVFFNGHSVRVPAGIGINIKDPGVQHGPTPTGIGYGGISMCQRPCISPLHTHDGSGVLHTESQISHPNRLGQFFIEWGVRLTATCVGSYCRPATSVGVYVDGKRYTANPADITLTDRKEIAIVIGSPPAHIPTAFPT